jgi:hypothetical protein
MDAAPTNGNRVILGAVGSSSGTTAVSSTNTTWTRMGTGFTDTNGDHFDIWVGVAAASAGAAITVTNTSTFVQLVAIEVTDTLTPTSTTLQGSNAATLSGFDGTGAVTNLTAAGSGHLLAIMAATDNAGNQPRFLPYFPVTFISHQTGVDFFLAYTLSGPHGGSTDFASAGAVLMVEIT